MTPYIDDPEFTPEQNETFRKLHQLIQQRTGDEDTSWIDDLPEYVPIPQAEGETVAVFVPRKGTNE